MTRDRGWLVGALALWCAASAAVAWAQDAPPVKFDRARWIERWRKEARAKGVELTDAEFDEFLQETFAGGVAGVSRTYAEELGREGGEPAARQKAISGLKALVGNGEAPGEEGAALRLLERFMDLPDERAGAPAEFAGLAEQLPVGTVRAQAAGATVRAWCRLEKFDEARAALAKEQEAFGERAGLLAPYANELRVTEIRSQLRVGRTAPELVATTMEGAPWVLSKRRGRVVVVYFWSRADRESTLRLAELTALAARHAGDAFDCVGVPIDEALDALRRFCTDWGVGFPQLCAGKGWQDAAPQAWAVTRLPSLFLLDRSGVVRQLGPKGAAALDAMVVKLLAEKPPEAPGGD